MSQSNLAFAPTLAVVNGKPTTLSTDMARHFGKRHDDVLRAIRNLLPQLPDGGVRNFAETPYTDPQNGQTYSAYRLTRDGFTLLAMGFTGKKALAFKLAYIDAFNAMEAALHKPGREKTLNEMVDLFVKQVETPNGAPTHLFMPLVNAVLRKRGFDLMLPAIPTMESSYLLPPAQAKEITDRLERLGQMFHPSSNQFLDVLGVTRALRGLHPRLGMHEPSYRQVIPRIAA